MAIAATDQATDAGAQPSSNLNDYVLFATGTIKTKGVTISDGDLERMIAAVPGNAAAALERRRRLPVGAERPLKLLGGDVLDEPDVFLHPDLQRRLARAIFATNQQIIPGLERELMVMHPGDEKKVVVKPEDAYGPVVPNAQTEVPKDSVPKEGLKVGTPLMARSGSGETRPVVVKEIKDKSILEVAVTPVKEATVKGKVTGTGAQDWNVLGGTLSVNGIINGLVTVNAGGTLGGTGTIDNIFVNGGVLAPGFGARRRRHRVGCRSSVDRRTPCRPASGSRLR